MARRYSNLNPEHLPNGFKDDPAGGPPSNYAIHNIYLLVTDPRVMTQEVAPDYSGKTMLRGLARIGRISGELKVRCPDSTSGFCPRKGYRARGRPSSSCSLRPRHNVEK